MMGSGKRRCIRGITCSWPAANAAAFQASLSLLSVSISLTVLPCSTMPQAGQQGNQVVPMVTTGAALSFPGSQH